MSVGFHRATQYVSGEPICAGDRVNLAGDAGVIEFVLRAGDCPPGHEWYAERFGCGFMIVTQRWGSIFKNQSDEDLEFIGRAH